MSLVRKLVVVALLAWCPTNAVDPRQLQQSPGRTSSPTGESDGSQPTYEQVVERLVDLSRKYRTLEDDLEDALDKQASLTRTLRSHNSLLTRLQPILDNFAHFSDIDSRLAAMEERLGERCTCEGPGGGQTPTDRPEEKSFEGWVEQLDRDQIEQIRNGFNSVSQGAGRSKDGGGSNAVDDDDRLMPEENLRILSRAFAGIISKQAEEEGIPLAPDTEVEDRAPSRRTDTPTEAPQRQTPQQQNAEGRPRPQEEKTRPRPGGFPFGRTGRSVIRHPREVTEEQLQEDLYGLFSELDRAKKKTAFSAVRTQPLFGSNSEPKPIAFQKNTANKGKNFIKDDGVFTCVIPGLYYFSYTMRSYDGKHIGVALMLNGDPVVAMTTDASQRKVMQTQSVILTLAAGDEVWLLLGPSDDFALYGNDFNYNTFNGVLLAG